MSTQPEALRLADALTPPTYPDWVTHAPTPSHPPSQEVRKAAAELRRLHGVNAELLAALKEIEWSNDDTWRTERARAAIAKATGELI